MNDTLSNSSERLAHDCAMQRHETEVRTMIAALTRRFILISLAFAIVAGAVAFAVGKQDRHSRSWVAGQSVPCVVQDVSHCIP
ncbi:hypothetical protein [Hoeflea sp.]|uniref:hypothetical protein n=1 Tax=Hoeflea sp. TaxID=1940281 RepID=UPI003B020F41